MSAVAAKAAAPAAAAKRLSIDNNHMRLALALRSRNSSSVTADTDHRVDNVISRVARNFSGTNSVLFREQFVVFSVKQSLIFVGCRRVASRRVASFRHFLLAEHVRSSVNSLIVVFSGARLAGFSVGRSLARSLGGWARSFALSLAADFINDTRSSLGIGTTRRTEKKATQCA